ncbi:MAG: hypothetical protein KDD32_04660 [Bacteroidetes bacterium]|nr:hypothetical protein [Bacteroidota bacterium]
MNTKTKDLFEAHVAFTLSELTGDQLKQTIESETVFIWEQLAKIKLDEVITKEEIIDFQKRNFDHRDKVAEPVKAYAKSLRNAVIDYLKTNDTKLKDVVDHGSYKKMVNEIAGLTDIRKQLIHSAVSNPLYGEVLANILSNGIKSFTSEEGLAGKIPGASSLFKMGGGILSGLSDSLDKNVRKFVTENIPKLTAQSEGYINSLIDERKVREIGEKIWDKGNEKSIGYGIGKIDVEQFEDFEPIIESMVNHFLKSDYANEINAFVIDHFLKENGQKSLQLLLTDIEITKEDVTRESVEFFSKVGAQALSDGSLETRVRLHLSKFYESDVVGKILS